MKRPDIRIVFAGILLTLFLASTVFAAYEFYVVKLTSKNPINWAFVQKAINSVQGVEKTQIDQATGLVTVTCSNKCDVSLLDGVKSKLNAKGMELQIITQPTLVDGKDPRVKKAAPAKKAF